MSETNEVLPREHFYRVSGFNYIIFFKMKGICHPGIIFTINKEKTTQKPNISSGLNSIDS